MTKKQWFWRWTIYVLGVIILAVGITLTTKTNIGVMPLSAIPFGAAEAFGVSFAVVNFIFYVLLVAGEFLLKGQRRSWLDLLQLPFSFVFSALLGLLGDWIDLQVSGWQNYLVMAAAIILNGIGVSMTVHMQMVPNPAEGLMEAVSVAIGRSMGFTKNLVDISCVVVAFFIDLLFGTLWTSVGLGTVVAMVTIGRAVEVFDRRCKDSMLALAGLTREN